MKLYLASESPRRRHMLSWLDLHFETVDHGVDESEYREKDGKEMVKNLSLVKAYGGAEKVKDGLVIGSDLTVELNRKIYDKPKDIKEGKKMLMELAGRTHMVYAGVAVVEVKTGEAVMSVDEVRVKMKKYDEKIVDEYIKRFEVLDKGGGYSIQFELPDYGSIVEKIDGSITTILGMPMEYLANLLKEFKVSVKKDWRKVCKIETGYDG